MKATMPTRKRSEKNHLPRERAMEEGVFALSDAELLTLLLGTGHRGVSVGALSAHLLGEMDGLDGIARCGPVVLARQMGMGPAKALRVLAGIEFGRRYIFRAGRRREAVTSSRDIFEQFGPVLGTLDHEQMWVVAMDGASHVRAIRSITNGPSHACGTHPRDILKYALMEGAIGLVIVHNHPSGSSAPSMEDLVLTKRLLAAADLVGITVVDHVIISSMDDYRSMLDLGLIPERVPMALNPIDLCRPYSSRLPPSVLEHQTIGKERATWSPWRVSVGLSGRAMLFHVRPAPPHSTAASEASILA